MRFIGAYIVLILTFNLNAQVETLDQWECKIKIPHYRYNISYQFNRNKKCLLGPCHQYIQSLQNDLSWYRVTKDDPNAPYDIGNYTYKIKPYINIHNQYDCLNDPNYCNQVRDKYKKQGEQSHITIGFLKKNYDGSPGNLSSGKYRPQYNLFVEKYELEKLRKKRTIKMKSKFNGGVAKIVCKKNR